MCIHFRAYCMPRALELVVGVCGGGRGVGGGDSHDEMVGI